jgi:hypothetical protein
MLFLVSERRWSEMHNRKGQPVGEGRVGGQENSGSWIEVVLGAPGKTLLFASVFFLK